MLPNSAETEQEVLGGILAEEMGLGKTVRSPSKNEREIVQDFIFDASVSYVG